MNILFYLHAVIAVFSMTAAMIITKTFHALLLVAFSIINLSICLYIISMPIAGAILAIIYAGAIMILFVFALMIIKDQKEHKISFIKFTISFIVAILFSTYILICFYKDNWNKNLLDIQTNNLFINFLSSYGFLVEMVSFLLLSALVASALISSNHIDSKVKS